MWEQVLFPGMHNMNINLWVGEWVKGLFSRCQRIWKPHKHECFLKLDLFQKDKLNNNEFVGIIFFNRPIVDSIAQSKHRVETLCLKWGPWFILNSSLTAPPSWQQEDRPFQFTRECKMGKVGGWANMIFYIIQGQQAIAMHYCWCLPLFN